MDRTDDRKNRAGGKTGTDDRRNRTDGKTRTDGKIRGRRPGARKGLRGLLVLCFTMVFAAQLCSYGQETEEKSPAWINPDTGYQVWVEDEAGLLTEEQLTELSQVMEGITAYGNVGFVTTDNHDSSTENFARGYYRNRFGTDSGTIFVIDMDKRNIWIHSDGAVWKVVTAAYADTITDNVYRYASRGDYYGCAREAFEEIHKLLKGQKIARPMKYISNALLAMILAMLANYGLVICFTRLHQPKRKALLANMERKFRYSQIKAVHTHQTKIYDPVSSGSGGGSSGHSSGGGGGHSGGGGGGHSGGGGGHSF